MLSRILGIITIFTGLLWLVKPEILKNRLKKKMNRKLRLAIFGFVVAFGFLIIGAVFKIPGVLPKIAGIIGLIIAIKGILVITSKASERMLEWLGGKPIIFFRVWAAFILATGLILVLS